MIKLLDRFAYIYLLFYSLILYYFFSSFYNRERSFNIKAPHKSDIDRISFIDVAKEKKFFLDLKYRKKIQACILDNIEEHSILIDRESKVLGCKQVNYRQQFYTKFSVYLNKKLVHSSIFGSIKLIKI